MFDNLSLEFRNDHIYISHGDDYEISSDGLDDFWTFLGEQCRRFNCTRVLVEARAPKRTLDTVAAFTSGVEAAAVASDFWLALCFHQYEPDELSDLFRQAALNRGAHVEFFTDCDAALNWLRVHQDRF